MVGQVVVQPAGPDAGGGDAVGAGLGGHVTDHVVAVVLGVVVLLQRETAQGRGADGAHQLVAVVVGVALRPLRSVTHRWTACVGSRVRVRSFSLGMLKNNVVTLSAPSEPINARSGYAITG